jgi:RND superfamily putative drug exporter
MLRSLARSSFRHRRLVLAAWVLVLVAAGIGGKAIAGDWAQGGKLPGTDSQRASDVLEREFPRRSGEDGTVVFADATRDRPAIDRYLASVRGVDGVTEVEPLRTSDGGKVALASITFDDRDAAKSATSKVRDLAQPLVAAGQQVEFGGWIFAEGDMPATEALGILAAVVILLIAFGSVLAMGLPIVTALVGIGIALAGVGGVASLMDTPDFTPQVATMVGLGVGIDYALFIVTRYRAALARGATVEDGVLEAVDTAGRAVVFAGCTVVVSLMGMFLMGLSFLHGLAVGTSLAVAIAVLAAVTLLPALLGFLGLNINKLRIGRGGATEGKGAWHRWAEVVQRRPVPIAVVGLGVLLAAAIPVLSMRLGVADAGNDPTSSTTRRANDLIAQGFGPGANGPILVVADTAGLAPSARTGALAKVHDAIAADPGIASVGRPTVSPSGGGALFTAMPRTGPQDAATTTLLHHLRDDVIPGAVAGTGAEAYLGGQTALDADFSSVLGARLPLFITGVLVLSFLLLLAVFRSVLVPLKAVIMNLLSIGAAYGVMVAVFQWGWGGSVVGVSPAPIEPWVPMMLFAIVFGLSMDYEVFLLSAVREEYGRSRNNRGAVAMGLEHTARVITAAALIMVCVFASFVLADVRALKLIGLGLAVAVFIDASIVRVVLVPATMELLGDANWWLPRWLDRLLPHLAVEGHPVDQPASNPAPGSEAAVAAATEDTAEPQEPGWIPTS